MDFSYLKVGMYITTIFSNFHMDEAKFVSAPLSISILLTANGSSNVDDAIGYRMFIGLLQYLNVTRPDIAFVANRLS